MPDELPPPSPTPAPAPAAASQPEAETKAEAAAPPHPPPLDLEALLPMPQGKGLGHVADKWRLPPGPVNTFLILLSIVGMIGLSPSLFRFALAPAPEDGTVTSLFPYGILLRLILFLACLGFFCGAAGFRFAHWLAGKITDLIFGTHDG